MSKQYICCLLSCSWKFISEIIARQNSWRQFDENFNQQIVLSTRQWQFMRENEVVRRICTGDFTHTCAHHYIYVSEGIQLSWTPLVLPTFYIQHDLSVPYSTFSQLRDWEPVTFSNYIPYLQPNTYVKSCVLQKNSKVEFLRGIFEICELKSMLGSQARSCDVTWRV